MTTRSAKYSIAALGTIASLVVASCGEQNLWNRDFPKPADGNRTAASAGGPITGYWEGQVAMGGVRARIESARITLALKCDRDGKILSQGAAPIAFNSSSPAAFVLQEDLSSGKDEVCGFLFYKGNEFRYRLREDGSLQLDFAGTSMAQMRKLAD